MINALAIPGSKALEVWSQQAQGSFARNTERAWASDWRAFAAWCTAAELSALPAMPETVADYLRFEAQSRSLATIRRRAATIARAHRAASLPNPCDSEPVTLALRAISRQKGTQQKQAPALTEREALLIRGRWEAKASLRDLRDLAVMLVGRDLMARASELVSITVEAISWQEDATALVALRRHKTSTEALPYLIGPEAAASLQRWLTAAQVASGPAFRALTRSNRVKDNAIGVRDISRILDRLAPGASFSAHSLRVGMAVDLSASNAEAQAIMQAAGWQSPAMLTRYTRKLDAKRGAIARYYSGRK